MVKIQVDLEHREKLRRLHTATHIVNFCAREVLGNHVWQNGSNLKAEFGTLDITHYENLTQEEIFKIERMANETVFEDKTVKIEEIDRAEAEKKYGFSLYQGGAIPMKKLRIIHVSDSDIEACGGIHMEKTGGIGLIKIVDTQKIQDGVVRLKYVVRDFALEEIESKQNIIEDLKEVFRVDEKALKQTSEKFFNEWKKQRNEIDKLKDEFKKSVVEQIKASKDDSFNLKYDADMGFMMEVFSQIKKSLSKRSGWKPRFSFIKIN